MHRFNHFGWGVGRHIVNIQILIAHCCDGELLQRLFRHSQVIINAGNFTELELFYIVVFIVIVE